MSSSAIPLIFFESLLKPHTSILLMHNPVCKPINLNSNTCDKYSRCTYCTPNPTWKHPSVLYFHVDFRVSISLWNMSIPGQEWDKRLRTKKAPNPFTARDHGKIWFLQKICVLIKTLNLTLRIISYFNAFLNFS